MDELIRFAALDGVWEVGGADRRAGMWPEGLNCTWDNWGGRTARFTLRRDPGVQYPDLGGFTPVEIEKGGGVWEGFVDGAPEGDDFGLAVECVGWPDHGNDDLEQKWYAHTRLADWQDSRSHLAANLATKWWAGGEVQADRGVISMGVPKGGSWPASGCVGVFLDQGATGPYARRVVVGVRRGAGAPTVVDLMMAVGVSGPDAGTLEFATLDADISNMPQTEVEYPFTITNTGRYLALFLKNNGAAYTTTNDDFVQVTFARTFADGAYESSGDSILKASDVLRDALPRLCPLWSPDVSGVDATLFNLAEVAPTEPRTFRELSEGLNALHGYALKLERGRRLRFKPLPSTPVLTAPDAPGVALRNLSRGSARAAYNRVVGVAAGPDGRPVAVERWAGQQPGVVGEFVAGAFANPSFDVDASGWTAVGGIAALVRDTSTSDTSPASGKQVASPFPSSYNRADLVGTFKRNTSYRLSFAWKRNTVDNGPVVQFGDVVAGDYVSLPLLQTFSGPLATWAHYTLIWVPRTTTSAAQVRLWESGANSGTAWFDSFALESVRPTVVDRRGFVRTKVLSVNQEVDAPTLQQFCDAWLQSHLRTQFRGDLTVTGRALVDYLTGESVDPFAIGELTMELAHLPGEIDPDTGALGRDGRIVSVSYDGASESAQVSIDSTAESFDNLVARFNMLGAAAGGG